MDGVVNLCIRTGKGTLSIPFLSLNKLDQFTQYFSDSDALVSDLCNMLGIYISQFDIQSVYVSKQTSNFLVGKKDVVILPGGGTIFLPIKYSEDAYDKKDLMNCYIKYLQEDIKRLNKPNFQFMWTEKIKAFLYDNALLTDIDIENYVRKCFNKEAGLNYDYLRTLYFAIKKAGYRVKSISTKKKPVTPNANLSSFETLDEYFQYLISLATKEPERCEQIMDEIAGYDLEELRSKLGSSNNNLVDGLGNTNQDNEDLFTLSYLTGLSVDELLELAKRFSKSYGRNKR